jgi:MerR family copper efflux transcriptional regulator
MKISELAHQTGLSIDTIRFYEKRGLLDDSHFSRGSNRYRDYSDVAVDRLLLIKQGQAAGLTLTEIARSIRAWESNQLTPQEKEDFFLQKMDEIDARISSLELIKVYIREKLKMVQGIKGDCDPADDMEYSDENFDLAAVQQ